MRAPIPVSVLVLLVAALATGQQQQEAKSDTPVIDEYYRLSRRIDDLDGIGDPPSKAKAKELRKERSRLRKALREEIGALNAKIYEARQAELLRRAHPEVPEGRKLDFTLEDYPLVNGSTSTHPLGVLVACRLLGIDYQWTNRYRRPSAYGSGMPAGAYRFELSDFLVQYRVLATGESRYAARAAAIVNQQVVIHNGTHGAYVALTEKRADLALIARRPSGEEVKAAAGVGVMFDVRPVALDAFVFLVHRANPVRGLTTKQLKGIYTGRVGNWMQLGGKTRPIDAYQRNQTSGSQQLMLSVFLKEKPLPTSSKRLIRNSMGGPFSALTGNPDGIAYSVYFYEHFMAASPYTRTLAVDGVVPTAKTIGDRSYPYATDVFVVVRKDEPAVSNARKLRDWLLTGEGQAVVAESGYVPLPKD